MSKIPRTKLAASLFDLRQDLIEAIPVEIIERWLDSDQSEATATTILESTKVRGTVVSSDAAGLTRLSGERELIEVLALIDRPKEILYAAGTAIGGRGIGIWAADNTQMFFGEGISPDKILSMLFKLQNELLRECEVKIGIGAHFGEFYHLGGGMYGEHADFIEAVTEDLTVGGEIVYSETLFNEINDKTAFPGVLRKDIDEPLARMFRLQKAPDIDLDLSYNATYPIPFSREFYHDLKLFQRDPTSEHLQLLHEQYVKEKVIVLAAREQDDSAVPAIWLLNDLALSALLEQRTINLLKQYHGQEIKNVGNLAIYAFTDHFQAFDFSLELRQVLEDDGVLVKIGIDSGPVIVFKLPRGTRDIVGNPINITSKLVQDGGEFGKIYLTDNIYQHIDINNFNPIFLEICKSAVVIKTAAI
jgi:class 3 adenylate cyclase